LALFDLMARVWGEPNNWIAELIIVEETAVGSAVLVKGRDGVGRPGTWQVSPATTYSATWP
tara:strand:+ start:1462 stop:1644 length:183 start_codon:yes stop_codon:yes gene_type:complete